MLLSCFPQETFWLCYCSLVVEKYEKRIKPIDGNSGCAIMKSKLALGTREC